ncbi:MAG: right-handed parallel beta-helix repeat-containing protein [Planctomycetes bacterium]|nr:right-handed parallel beta-helix repeat-containing protein [Planctomycetota bacterium]
MKTCWTTLCVFSVCLAAPAEGAKLKVPGDYGTIQAAVNAGSAGDVIEVSQGTYFEDVAINKSDITLRAKSGDTVTIDAGGAGTPLPVAVCSGVTVQKIRLRNTANSVGLDIVFASSILIKGCAVDNASNAGISANVVTEVVIEECSVKNAGGDGIYLYGNSSVVRDTTVRKAGAAGIRVTGTANTIEGNTIEDVADAGIKLGDDPSACADCLVIDNEIDGCWDGIFLDGVSTGNSVLENEIASALYDGIELAPGADANIVSGNNIRVDYSGMECGSNSCCISKNRVTNSDDGIVVEIGAQYCLFYKNKVKKSGSDGFFVQGVSNTLIENQAKNSGGFDLHDLTAPGANAYLGNSFTTVAP